MKIIDRYQCTFDEHNLEKDYDPDKAPGYYCEQIHQEELKVNVSRVVFQPSENHPTDTPREVYVGNHVCCIIFPPTNDISIYGDFPHQIHTPIEECENYGKMVKTEWCLYDIDENCWSSYDTAMEAHGEAVSLAVHTLNNILEEALQ